MIVGRSAVVALRKPKARLGSQALKVGAKRTSSTVSMSFSMVVVAFDYLQLLLDELNKNASLNYEPVAVLTNLIAEAPAIGPTGLFDVRFTDRVVFLARTDLNKNDSTWRTWWQHTSP